MTYIIWAISWLCRTKLSEGLHLAAIAIVESGRLIRRRICSGTLSTYSNVDQIHCGRFGVFCTM